MPRLKVNDGTCPEKPDHLSSARLVVTRTSREELLPWFVGAAIPAAFVTRPPWAGGPTAAASREHLLSKGRTGYQRKGCQDSRQTSDEDSLQPVLRRRGRSRARATGTNLRPLPQPMDRSNTAMVQIFQEALVLSASRARFVHKKNPLRVRHRQGKHPSLMTTRQPY